MRHQLLVLALDRFAGPEPARTAGAVWHGLSRAMHHHTYELPPTTAELQNWHGDVARLLTALAEGTPAALVTSPKEKEMSSPPSRTGDPDDGRSRRSISGPAYAVMSCSPSGPAATVPTPSGSGGWARPGGPTAPGS